MRWELWTHLRDSRTMALASANSDFEEDLGAEEDVEIASQSESVD
jgi:hypothetical protein